jgi:hypothetical protein
MSSSIFANMLFIFCLVVPQVAYAYIDPGAGSSVVEIIIAFVVGGFFFIKLYYRKIMSAFRRKKDGENKT